ncbi:hybrid sensor histidine kinase/response regulator [Haliangium ochraceum]|uniref:histidine kinase n=1 Tax=Haliangium ochraceum (strain DSM 14365 / JCM 11303 / SMP-2) TaxID=502025 RepID=D0LIN4_HALO1|nr:PAS domain-containing hybrid sensor histidine kinase/response regulator [Haliangium ochraceum]ACY18390.1 multi-sensor hybrid histidine kinase [Haliangium ochraceum DSM 14365]
MSESVRRAAPQRPGLEFALPLLIVLVIGLGWYVALRYAKAIEETVVASYQETQLEIVRAVARSAELYLEEELAKGTERQTIEQTIFRRFVAPIKLQENGDAWIFAPTHSVFDLSQDFPEEYANKSIAEIFEIQKEVGATHYEQLVAEVMNAREGVGWYVWLPDKGPEIGAWTPVGMGAYVWTVGLSTPLSEIMDATGATAQIRILYAVMGVATFLGLGLTLLATRSMLMRQRTERKLQYANIALGDRVDELRLEIEKRERAQRANRESEDKYRSLFESAGDGIIVFSDDSTMLDVNPAACALYRCEREELLKRPPEQLFHADYRDLLRAQGQHMRDAGRFRAEVQGSRFDGSLFDAEVTGTTYQLDGADYVLLNIRDISERVEAERNQQTLELALARSKKMEALGLLAGGVAHDLNNILSGIAGLPDVILADLPPEDEETRMLLETVKESGIRAAAVVADLMTISKGIAAPRTVLSLNDTVRQYLLSGEYRDLKARFPAIRFRTELSSELGNIRGVAVNLKQALINLTVNAAEAVGQERKLSGEQDPPGENTITIRTRNQRIEQAPPHLGSAQPGNYAVLTVADDGPGIPPENLERIFEPFYTSKSTDRSGTGLGLVIVWNAVEDHGGFVDVRSDEGGAIFELYLPITDEALTVQHTPLLQDLVGEGEQVLVVDDEPQQRLIACKMLQTLGYRPHAVASGEQALAFVDKQLVDLVLLDMVMEPGMNGHETYERILALRPGQRAILASGYSPDEAVRAAQALGAGEYLKKPYTMEQLGIAAKLELGK